MPKLSQVQRAISRHNRCSVGLKNYFGMLDELLSKVSLPYPALAYCFQRIESAQRITLYALLMRKYRTNSDLAWNAIDRLDLTRSNYPDFYHALSGKRLDPKLREILKPAELARDKITHGKICKPSQVLEAIILCLDYAEAFDGAVYVQAGFRPFGPLRGVTSSKRPQLEREISRLVIKGLGLAPS